MSAQSTLASELHSLQMMTNSEKSVLVVEDDKLLNWSMVKSLSKWGFNVRSVCSGKDALSLLDGAGIGIFLLDYQLPDVDGLQVARQIRKAYPGALIFLVTAFQLNELTVEAGLIDGYFNKPVDLQQLYQAILNLQLPAGQPAPAGVAQPLI